MGTNGAQRLVGIGTGRNGREPANVALHRINDILEEQSKRIAHAVHDEAGQLLAAVFLRLDQASRELSPSCGSCFDEIKRMLQMIEVQLREIAHDLRPMILDDLGLVPAVEEFIQRVARRYGIETTCESALPARLSPPVETTIYRIVQESLNNVVKHAHATRVEIRIACEGRHVSCLIRDNGTGFNLNEVLSRKGSRGLGLVGIRERVDSVRGDLTIHSVPGNGTVLSFTIPIGD
jgi:two-component system, NarL family, sensor histidine kinase DegS